MIPPKLKMNLRQRMDWLMGFLNEDIETISVGEVLKLLYEIEIFIAPRSMLTEKHIANIPNGRDKLKKNQAHLKDMITQIWETGLEGPPSAYLGPSPPTILDYYVLDGEIRVRYRAQSEDEEEAFRLRLDNALIEVLRNFPLSGIKRCEREDCRKWFFQHGKREKRFCTNRCALITNKRRRRGGLKRKKLVPKED